LRPCPIEDVVNTLVAVASEFSPRYERHRDDLVSIDVSGLDRLIGPPATIGEELRRDATARGMHVHVALARTRAAALVLAVARPGLTVVDPGDESTALAPLSLNILEKIHDDRRQSSPFAFAQGRQSMQRDLDLKHSAVSALKHWGLRTLGELAALPPAELSSRLGQQALAWQAIARGEDTAPLVPALPEERFESSLDLEWPVEDLEPMSFVLTRLLEPLSVRLERRDRGAAVLHLELRLVTHSMSLTVDAGSTDQYDRHLQLPSPIRDVRTLRTLLLLDLESHPPPAAVDRVTILIDPTPGRVVQHTLFTRTHPTPEQLSTLLARLGALMGQDRIGAPATVDSHRPGAFRMEPFATDHDDQRRDRGDRRESYLKNSADSAISAFDRDHRRNRPSHSLRADGNRREISLENSAGSASSALNVVSALRRCRQPVPARVVIEDGRPTRLTTDRRGFAGGRVLIGTGPWRTSGNWWAGQSPVISQQSPVRTTTPTADKLPTADCRLPTVPWNRDEWDVALADGAVYRVFRDRETDGWFIDAIVD
jgi:protein ImuB